MTIGAGIFLIAVGAILKFATNFHVLLAKLKFWSRG